MKKNLKKMAAVLLSGALVLSLAACGGNGGNGGNGSNGGTSSGNAGGGNPSTPSGGGASVTLQVGFENSSSEPFGQGMAKWQELLAAEDCGLEISLYPDSQLGDKSSLIDSMTLGEGVCTLADGAFYADYGVNDFGIVFGPFLFEEWDDCWTLIESDWYKAQCEALEQKGLHIIASNWMYGARHTLTTKPVNTVDDLYGLKIRVPTNQIQTQGFEVLGATGTGMPLGDVYTALSTGNIDGAENPLATLYGRSLQEVAKYLILDGHVLNFTTLVCSADWYNSLTPEQQTALTETCKAAAEYNNGLVKDADGDYLQKMKDAGVTVVEPSDEVLAGFREKAQAFYDMGSTFGWSDGLYDTVKAAMGK